MKQAICAIEELIKPLTGLQIPSNDLDLKPIEELSRITLKGEDTDTNSGFQQQSNHVGTDEPGAAGDSG